MVEKPKHTGSPVVGCRQVLAASPSIAAFSPPLSGGAAQQLADDREAQVRPPLVNPPPSRLLAHAGAPLVRVRLSVGTVSGRPRRACSAGWPPPSESAHADATGDRAEKAQQGDQPILRVAAEAVDQRRRKLRPVG